MISILVFNFNTIALVRFSVNLTGDALLTGNAEVRMDSTVKLDVNGFIADVSSLQEAVSVLTRLSDSISKRVGEVQLPRSSFGGGKPDQATMDRCVRLYDKMRNAFTCTVCFSRTQPRLWKCCFAVAVCMACETELIRKQRSKFSTPENVAVSIRCLNCHATWLSNEAYIRQLAGSDLQQAVELCHGGEHPVSE